MSIFDKYKILHGLPEIGQKITFVKPTRSWFTNVEEDQKKLTIGQEYTVRKTELNSSSTYVWLEEFPNIFDDNDPTDGRDQPFFNMGSFEWVIPPINPNDLIGLTYGDVLTLNRKYRIGIKYKNYAMVAVGNPVLVIECVDNVIKNAYFE